MSRSKNRVQYFKLRATNGSEFTTCHRRSLGLMVSQLVSEVVITARSSNHAVRRMSGPWGANTAHVRAVAILPDGRELWKSWGDYLWVEPINHLSPSTAEEWRVYLQAA